MCGDLDGRTSRKRSMRTIGVTESREPPRRLIGEVQASSCHAIVTASSSVARRRPCRHLIPRRRGHRRRSRRLTVTAIVPRCRSRRRFTLMVPSAATSRSRTAPRTVPRPRPARRRRAGPIRRCVSERAREVQAAVAGLGGGADRVGGAGEAPDDDAVRQRAVGGAQERSGRGDVRGGGGGTRDGRGASARRQR